MNTCANCHHSFKGNYCSHCGQKASVGRLTLHEVAHDTLHSFTHADRGILRLIHELFTSPSSVYQGYFAGKRKSYFSPVMFFLLVIGINIFVMTKFMDWESATTGSANPVRYALITFQKIRYLIFIPVISVLTWVFFRKRYNLAEIVAFWFFLCGFIMVIDIIAYLPRFVFFERSNTIAVLTDWTAFGVTVYHLFRVFYHRTLGSALSCILIGISFYFILVYIYLVIASVKGFSVDFNLWHIVVGIFR